MKRKFIAALHLQPSERKKVITAGNKATRGITNNPLVFTAPTPYDATDFQTETELLEQLDAAADGGSDHDVSAANEQAVKVYNMLHDELPYIDSVAKGVKSVIELFCDASEEPQPHAVPDAPVIDRIVDGKEAVTFLVRVKECLEDPQRFILEL